MNTHHIGPEEDEAPNLEQFQVGRPKDKSTDASADDDSSYTRQEKEFADGEGTQLAEAFDEEDEEQDDN